MVGHRRTYRETAGNDRRAARLDAAWKDDAHFLTLAQSDAGKAAIIRCDLTGVCERASRVWDVPVPLEPSLYYAKPPVVLATP